MSEILSPYKQVTLLSPSLSNAELAPCSVLCILIFLTNKYLFPVDSNPVVTVYHANGEILVCVILNIQRGPEKN